MSNTDEKLGLFVRLMAMSELRIVGCNYQLGSFKNVGGGFVIVLQWQTCWATVSVICRFLQS